MKTSSVMPAATASSTAYWISGLSTTGNISLGLALVAGKKRVPRPATGNTAFVIMLFMSLIFPFCFPSRFQQLQQACLVQYSNPQLARLVELAAGVLSGNHEIGFFRHAAADLAAMIAYFLRRLVALESGQGSRQHKSFAVSGIRGVHCFGCGFRKRDPRGQQLLDDLAIVRLG